MLERSDRTTPREGARLLARWQKRRRLAAQDAAAVVGLSPAEYSRFIASAEAPGMKRAMRIEAATGGAVPIGSWVVEARR